MKPTSSQLLLHPPSQLTYSNTRHLTAAGRSEASARGQTSQSATPALNRGVGQEERQGCVSPGEELKRRRFVPMPRTPKQVVSEPAAPTSQAWPRVVRSSRAWQRPRRHCLFFSTACSREIQLVEERSAVIYLRTNSLVPAWRSRRRGRRESGRLRSSPAAQAAPRTQVPSEEGKGDFLAFLPCKYLPGSGGGGGGGPTPLRGRWEAPRLAPASPAPRPRPRYRWHPPPAPAPLRSARRGNGQLGHPAAAAAAASGGGSADSPPATTRPGGSGMEYTKTQRKSGWTVLGAKCWKFVSATLRL